MPATRKKTTKAPPKKPTPAKSSRTAAPVKPIRREIGALAAFLLFIFTFLVILGVKAVVLDFLGDVTKSLIGSGVYVLPFALLAASLMLAFHRGRPVAARVAVLMTAPIFIGALVHLFSSTVNYPKGWAFFDAVIKSGQELTGGGLLSGSFAFILKAGLSQIGAVIVVFVLLVGALMIAFQYSIVRLADDFRSRPRKEYEPLPEPAPRPSRPAKADPAPTPPVKEKRAKKSDIDVPLFLTDEQLAQGAAQPETPRDPLAPKPGFSIGTQNVRSPADALLENPVPMPLPQVFAFDEVEYIHPETGELMDAPSASAPRAKADKAPWESDPPQPVITAPPPESAEAVYRFPPLGLLSPPKPFRETDGSDEVRMGAARLVEVIESFGLGVQIMNVTRGPSVTRYELEMESGQKLARLTGLATDIALAMGAESVNISPVPNKMSVVGVEVPNRVTSMVTLREVMESREFQDAKSPTTFAIGRDIGGRNIVADIVKMTHLLVAGSTGAGKSVCVNSLIVSLLYKASPDDLKLILIDPKKVEFPPYNGIPHLYVPVITDSSKAAAALEWAVTEMERRYAVLADSLKRDIDGYNEAYPNDPEHPKMCRIVIIVDEMADLIMESKKERNMENCIVRIAQKARACGIHLVLATQRPDAKVITGLIKANVPSRIALKVAGAINSRIVLDRPGAEKLIGHGDMLFAPVGSNVPARVQGCYVDERDINKIVEFLRQSSGEAAYATDVMEQIDRNQAAGMNQEGSRAGAESDEADPMLPAAIEVILDSGQGSVSFLQRRLKLGYARAARLMDLMEERGIVGPFEGSKPRKVLLTREQWEETGEA
ncbi:MAG: DNA translocase FtsK [Oscillospiraceae bacterium]|nr:DNA translocase FtsK [Oscillospiraceae bacterium]